MSPSRSLRYQLRGRVQSTDSDPIGLDHDHVRIRPAYVGLCGTDAHILHGAMDSRVPPNTVLGHEMSGWVVEVDEAVSGIQVGDLVVVRPVIPCSTCISCTAGHFNVCSSLVFLGIDRDGALQEDYVVSSALVHSAAGISPQRSALTEPLAVAVHDVRRADIRCDESCLIVGAGPIGILIASVLRNRGVSVAIIDTNEQRRKFAEALRFTALDPNSDNDSQFDVAFEVSGTGGGVETCMRLLRPRGRLIIVGIQTEPTPLSLFPLFWKELTVLGARLYSPDDFEEALSLMRDPSFSVDELITCIVAFSDFEEATERLHSGIEMKILVEIGGDNDRFV